MLQATWRKLVAFAAAFATLQSAAWAQHNYVSRPPLNPRQAHALEQAILILGIPALGIFIGILVYFYRRRSGSQDT